MSRMLLSPRWIVAHVVVLAIAVTFVSLGMWQLGRRDEVRAFNERYTARLAEPERPIAEVLAQFREPDDLAYRRVVARGRYDVSEEVLLRSRSYRGQSGHHLLDPFTSGVAAVVVDRGWVPLDFDEPPVAEAAPPRGEVTIRGVLFPPHVRGRFGPLHPPEGRLDALFRIDLERLSQQLPYSVAPVYLQLTSEEPARVNRYPIPVPLPDPDQGPHLSYALQWFSFTLVGLVGYGALIRNRLRAAARARADDDELVEQGSA